MHRLLPYSVPVVVGAVLAAGMLSYNAHEAAIVQYDRPAPTPEQIVAAEYASKNPAELLPDLVPLPGRDLMLSFGANGHLNLLFSTTYINIGRGNMELRADPVTAGIPEDIDRNVLQRIYKNDGTYRDILVGNFLWHQEHLHYHYADFVAYDLTAEGSTTSVPVAVRKATFCLRDVSRVLSDTAGEKRPATFTVCGKERQGVSVGWGDTYYYNYPDQTIDLNDVPSGTYRLTFRVNPMHRLEELAYSNNESSVTFTFDKQNRRVKVIEEFPETSPRVEHVHLDDPFGM